MWSFISWGGKIYDISSSNGFNSPQRMYVIGPISMNKDQYFSQRIKISQKILKKVDIKDYALGATTNCPKARFVRIEKQ